MPRPLAYDEEARGQIIAALERRASLRDAVALAGVAQSTFFDWLKAGRLWNRGPNAEGKYPDGADERFAQLARDVAQAVAETDAAIAGSMFRAAVGVPAQPATETTPARPEIPGDWRAGESLAKLRANAPLQQAQLAKLRAETARIKAETKVAEMRANGTLPAEKSEITGANGTPLVPATEPSALHARLAAVADRAARTAERRGPGGDAGVGASGDRSGA